MRLKLFLTYLRENLALYFMLGLFLSFFVSFSIWFIETLSIDMFAFDLGMPVVRKLYVI